MKERYFWISLFFIWILKKNVLSLYRKLKTKEQ